jgi:hypothetical protein
MFNFLVALVSFWLFVCFLLGLFYFLWAKVVPDGCFYSMSMIVFTGSRPFVFVFFSSNKNTENLLPTFQKKKSDGKEMAVPNHEAKYTTTLLFLFPKLNLSTSDGSEKLRVILL